MPRRTDITGTTPLTALRRFGPWLLALFLTAQIVAVAPLVASHTLHLAGSLAITSYQGDVNAISDNAGAGPLHHQGDEDSGPQHHALNDMAGVLVTPVDAAAASVHYVLIVAAPPDAVAKADSVQLERPPKTILSA
jgi:hypothetical protein